MTSARTKMLLIGAAGVVLCIGILLTGPEPLEASLPSQQPRVTIGELERSIAPTTITAFGTLQPRQVLHLTTQVPGEITWVSEQLDAGQQIARDEELLHLDQRDYLLAVRSAEAQLAQAKANIELEQGRAQIAQLEWSAWQASQEDNTEANPLALREPQRAEALARQQVIAAELDNARLALERTRIRAPWPATVVATNAIVGQLLNIGDVTATLFPIDYAVVELQLAASHLATLDAGITSVLLRPVHQPQAVGVSGQVQGIIRNLTDTTRLATLRVRVKEPLNQSGWAYGLHLQAHIETAQQRALAQIPADLIVSGNLVWVHREGQARQHQVFPVNSSGTNVLVEDNFEQADRLILQRPIGLFDGADVTALED